MNIVARLFMAAVALYIFTSLSAEHVNYYIEYGSASPQRIAVSKREFDALINASPNLQFFHHNNDSTAIRLPLDISSRMVYHLVDLVTNSVLERLYGKKKYTQEELVEITKAVHFLDNASLYKALIVEWAQRLADPKNLRRAVNTQWIAQIPLNNDIKTDIAQELFDSHIIHEHINKLKINEKFKNSSLRAVRDGNNSIVVVVESGSNIALMPTDLICSTSLDTVLSQLIVIRGNGLDLTAQQRADIERRSHMHIKDESGEGLWDRFFKKVTGATNS